jgi:hypothetical protein
MIFLTTVAVVSLVNGGTPMSAEATAQYQRASQDIQARSYPSAIETLNALALKYPKVPEIFASRCTALIGTGHYPEAEADCTYAIALKPNMPEALYALAMAEDHQGKAKPAAEHYRKYAAFDGAPMRDQALQRADALSGATPAPVAAASGARLTVYRNHRMAGSGPIMLILDGHVLGDIEMGTYVDIEAAPGAHMLEARSKPQDVFEMTRVWTHPVTLSGTTYVNFDTSGGQIVMQEVSGGQGRNEIREDCKRGWKLSGPFDNLPVAGPVQQPQVPAIVVVPGRGGVRSPSGGNGNYYCHSSIDCGPGGWCKDRGDGVNVCMSHGSRGEFCQSSIDCGGGLFCKDRGDGMNVCM